MIMKAPRLLLKEKPGSFCHIGLQPSDLTVTHSDESRSVARASPVVCSSVNFHVFFQESRHLGIAIQLVFQLRDPMALIIIA